MNEKLSTGLVTALMGNSGMREALTGMHLYIYAGAEPASADASIGAATLLCDLSGNGDGSALAFDAAPADGILLKDATQAWQGTNLAGGTATFFRIATPADTGALSTTAVRIQGDVAVIGGNLNISSTTLTSGAPQTVEYFAIGMPRA